MKPFRPNCMATTLPTMPHRDPVKACTLVLDRFPEAPCIPRLSRSARMYMDGVPCLVVDEEKRNLYFDTSKTEEIEEFYRAFWEDDVEHFAMNARHAQGIYTLLEILGENPPEGLKAVHTQMPGILTWALSLKDVRDGRPAWYDETMKDILTKSLIMKAKWQEKRVHQVVPEVDLIVTLGEPSLAMSSSPFGSIMPEDIVKTFDEIFGEVKCVSSVHCCSNMDWPLLMHSKIQIINFDAFRFADKFCLYTEEIKNFLERGGIISWGITPVSKENMNDVDAVALAEAVTRAMDRLCSGGIEKDSLFQKSMITPACVTSMLSEEESERVFQCTGDISRIMRSK